MTTYSDPLIQRRDDTAEQLSPQLGDVLWFAMNDDEWWPEVERVIAVSYMAGETLTGNFSKASYIEETNDHAEEYARSQAAQLVTSLSQAQRESVQQIVASAFINGTPDQIIAQRINKVVGLDLPGTNAVNSLFDNLTASGMPTGRAHQRAMAYADQLRYQRAQTIARTEVASALNHGLLKAWEDGIDNSDLDQSASKKWVLHPSERTCPTCVGLEGEVVPVKDVFDSQWESPPVHPNCNCTMKLVTPDGIAKSFEKSEVKKSANNAWRHEARNFHGEWTTGEFPSKPKIGMRVRGRDAGASAPNGTIVHIRKMTNAQKYQFDIQWDGSELYPKGVLGRGHRPIALTVLHPTKEIAESKRTSAPKKQQASKWPQQVFGRHTDHQRSPTLGEFQVRANNMSSHYMKDGVYLGAILNPERGPFKVNPADGRPAKTFPKTQHTQAVHYLFGVELEKSYDPSEARDKEGKWTRLSNAMTHFRSSFPASSNMRAFIQGKELAPAYQHDPYFKESAQALKEGLETAPGIPTDSWRIESGDPRGKVGETIHFPIAATAGSKREALGYRDSLLFRDKPTIYHFPAGSKGLSYSTTQEVKGKYGPRTVPVPAEYIVTGDYKIKSITDSLEGRVVELERTNIPQQLFKGRRKLSHHLQKAEAWRTELRKPHGPEGGRWVHSPITEFEARGDSARVTADQFQDLAEEGRKKLADLLSDTRPTTALNDPKKWAAIKQHAYQSVQRRWDGDTIDPATGEAIQLHDHFAVTVKKPGQESISVPIDASPDELGKAMDEAKVRFAEQLQGKLIHLGVFRDDAEGRIDIDPTAIVESVHDADTIGAFTHAVGGAYDFATTDGHFVPHIVHPDTLAPVYGQAGGGVAVDLKMETLPKSIREKSLKALAKYIGVTPEEAATNICEMVRAMTSAEREDASHWYEEAQKFNNEVARQTGLNPLVVTAITACLSPGQDWETSNTSGTEILCHMYANLTETQLVDPKVAEATNKYIQKESNPKVSPLVRPGETLGNILHGDTRTAAIYIAKAAKLGLRTYDNFEKAVKLAQADNPDIISETLRGAKVRSFFNNMVNPAGPMDVTIDSHMLRAFANGMDTPGGYERIRNIQKHMTPITKTPEYRGAGVGAYPVLADALREATASVNKLFNTHYTVSQVQAMAWVMQKKRFTRSVIRQALKEGAVAS